MYGRYLERRNIFWAKDSTGENGTMKGRSKHTLNIVNFHFRSWHQVKLNLTFHNDVLKMSTKCQPLILPYACTEKII